MSTYAYTGIEYVQRGSGKLVTFVAPVGDIKAWAGVPRKHFNYQHGFQRTLAEKRVNDLRDFYAMDAQNLTPTSVIVAVRKNACKITPELEVDPITGEKVPNKDGLCKIEFDAVDYSTQSTGQLIDLAITLLAERLGSVVVAEIQRNLGAAIELTIEAENEETTEGDFPEAQTPQGESMGEAPTSHLLHFYTELLAIKQGIEVIADEVKLREVLYSMLKPAIIVDGQHRVYGAAAYTESMRFSVNAIPEADWLEQVFQFVIINQKAKPIEPAFLHSIVATSLTEDEIGRLYKRLRHSGVDVDRAQFMNRINTDPESPFRGMIDFEVEGAGGFLGFPGMSSLAKTFKGIRKDYPGLVPEGTNWSSEDVWISHFYALWTGIKEYFSGKDARLWKEPTESNPNNLLKIVSLQEIQVIMLDTWANSRTFKFVDPAQTAEAARVFWDGFPTEFFTDEWKKKGLQTKIGRKYLSDAIQVTRRNIDRKSWGHRRLGLFQDL
jgi:hypothetical protein